jgi:hypothetical protein
MNATRGIQNSLCYLICALVIDLSAAGCQSTPSGENSTPQNVGTPGNGTNVGASSANVGAVGSPSTATTAAVGSTATGSGGTASPALTRCPGEMPLCVGLSGCPLAVCSKANKNEIPLTCSCLTGDALTRCCAEVKTAMGDCPDLTSYPECQESEKPPTCPTSVLQSLAKSTYKGINSTISADCQNCMCSNCITELGRVDMHGQAAIPLLQCAFANGLLRDCLVCAGGSCDVTLGTNLMTGPCSQEALNACAGRCLCGGAFDISCLSLGGCMMPQNGKTFPCAAAHSTAECMATKCTMCGTFSSCPSNLANLKGPEAYGP